MNWINIDVASIDSEWFKGEEPVCRATWLCLLRYCVGQENGGEIPGCLDWSDRKWQQLCAITREEVTTKSRLWFWNGASLRVWAYPVDAEEVVKKKRISGRKGAIRRWEQAVSASTTDSAIAHPLAHPMRKEKKGKENGTAPHRVAVRPPKA